MAEGSNAKIQEFTGELLETNVSDFFIQKLQCCMGLIDLIFFSEIVAVESVFESETVEYK